MRTIPVWILLCLPTVIFGSASRADEPVPAQRSARLPVFIERGPFKQSVLYANGAVVPVETETVWKPLCIDGSAKITVDDLRQIARISRLAAATHPAPEAQVQNVAGGPSPRFDIVFHPTTPLPAEAASALKKIEKYVEAQFTDPVTVTINFAFAPLGSGILGATSSNYASVTWPNMRDALTSGMDLDDVIQEFLPPGSTIPVRYDGNTSSVTNENRVFVTIANFRAAVGTISGTAASMTFNSSFAWDYDPPVFEVGGTFDFRSVITHEVGHALGFTSGADFRTNDMEALDVYRFQRSDGAGTDNNPDTYAEFTVTARMVDQNAPGTNDDVNSDLLIAEYQMSDGVPSQASHFHDQFPPIGIMDPNFAPGQTLYPHFFLPPDLAMFDAIGWDYPHFNTTCPVADITACNAQVCFDNLANNNVPDPVFSCGDGNSHIGALWYSFVATHDSAHISTCESDAPDVTFAVYEGDCGSLVEIACSEEGGCESGGGNSSICVAGLTPGNTYFVQVAARDSNSRDVISLQIECSCLGACCVPTPGTCFDTEEDVCLALGGTFAGGGSACAGDNDSDGRDDTCQASLHQFGQLPVESQESLASNIDTSDTDPSTVLADGFVADGRAIRSLRWWGTKLDVEVDPDGWLVSFHESLAEEEAAEPLGLYFCPIEGIAVSTTNIPGCDEYPVLQYTTRLADCCLIHAGPDSRSEFVPAASDGFLAEACAEYGLGIQAVIGSRWDSDGNGGCPEMVTGRSAAGGFWGWHSTSRNQTPGDALSTVSTGFGEGAGYGPWTPLIPTCGDSSLSFELLTSDFPGGGENVIWSNGTPNNIEALTTQFGGSRTDWMTVDDVTFPDGAAITDLHWTNEEQSTFVWDQKVRLEIYPDDGSGAPDESGGPTEAMWVPDDGGHVARTFLGQGFFQLRYQYDMTGLDIALPAGTWWIGIATAGELGSAGRAYWLSSHKKDVDPLFYGSESYLRAPSANIPAFVPWSTQTGGNMYDMSFEVTTTTVADCNCNGIPDDQDIGVNSDDCNANAIPDECEPDCNGSGVPDDCDLALGSSLDCQLNGVPDECDVFFGTSSDVDGGGVPDECCQVIDTPLRDPADPDKSRFITIPGFDSEVRAIRVRLASLHHPDPPYSVGVATDLSAFEGEVRWVGPPAQFIESDSTQTPFMAATLQCTPYYTDWGSVGYVHVTGSEVVPSSSYDVQWITEGCPESEESSYSAPLTIDTTRWGDVIDPFNPPSTTTQPDFGDIGALVNKFKSALGAPIKARALLAGDVPDLSVDVGFTHISACVDAFKGFGFPFSGPAPCPP